MTGATRLYSQAEDSPGVPLLTSHVLQRLAAYAPLSSEEKIAVLTLPLSKRIMVAGTELVAAGERARACFLVSGWACRTRTLPDGRRQIVSIVLPGDALVSPLQPDGRPALCATVALTRVQLADATPLRPLLDRAAAEQHGLWAACAAAEHAEEGLLLDHIVALGQLSAGERLCSLLAELCRRLTEAGLSDGCSFPLPLRQDVLADALSMSAVHVNRSLQSLRRAGVVEVSRGRAALLRPDVLSAPLAAATAVAA